MKKVLTVVLACFVFFTMQIVPGIWDRVAYLTEESRTFACSVITDSIRYSPMFLTLDYVKETLASRNNENVERQSNTSLDDWIGWAPLLAANGGLVTTPDSLNGQIGLNVELPINDSLN